MHKKSASNQPVSQSVQAASAPRSLKPTPPVLLINKGNTHLFAAATVDTFKSHLEMHELPSAEQWEIFDSGGRQFKQEVANGEITLKYLGSSPVLTLEERVNAVIDQVKERYNPGLPDSMPEETYQAGLAKFESSTSFKDLLSDIADASVPPADHESTPPVVSQLQGVAAPRTSKRSSSRRGRTRTPSEPLLTTQHTRGWWHNLFGH
jgi:hypothetical protein